MQRLALYATSRRCLWTIDLDDIRFKGYGFPNRDEVYRQDVWVLNEGGADNF